MPHWVSGYLWREGWGYQQGRVRALRRGRALFLKRLLDTQVLLVSSSLLPVSEVFHHRLFAEAVGEAWLHIPAIDELPESWCGRNCLALLRGSHCRVSQWPQLSLCLSSGWSAELTVTHLEEHVRDLRHLKKPPFHEERVLSLGDRTKPVEQSLLTRLCP